MQVGFTVCQTNLSIGSPKPRRPAKPLSRAGMSSGSLANTAELCTATAPNSSSEAVTL